MIHLRINILLLDNPQVVQVVKQTLICCNRNDCRTVSRGKWRVREIVAENDCSTTNDLWDVAKAYKKGEMNQLLLIGTSLSFKIKYLPQRNIRESKTETLFKHSGPGIFRSLSHNFSELLVQAF